MDNLEKDFDEVAGQINAKLKEAAAALREANRLSEEVGLPGLIYTQFTMDSYRWGRNVPREETEDLSEKWQTQLEKINVSELESELESAGWSTSSSYC